MRRRDFLALAGVAALGGVPSPGGRIRAARRDPQFVERWSWAMGQTVHLRLFHPSAEAGREAAQAACGELRRVEARLSLFDDASDLAELNRQAGRGWWRAGPDLRAVLASAEQMRLESAGAFNVAVEPLMRVWGFRAPRKSVPGVRELLEAREAVAAARVEFDGERVALPAAHTALDFGGIAVGYGLDRAGAMLRARGVVAALLEVSGDLLAIGAPPGEAGWPIDLVDPHHAGKMLRTVRIRDEALATSGNSATVVHLAGRTVGHVMDPVLGEPASRLAQATVAAPTGIAADARSTALLVRGRSEPWERRVWLER